MSRVLIQKNLAMRIPILSYRDAFVSLCRACLFSASLKIWSLFDAECSLSSCCFFSQLSVEYDVHNYVFKTHSEGEHAHKVSVSPSFYLKRQELKIEVLSASSRLRAYQWEYHLLMQILWGGGCVCLHFYVFLCVVVCLYLHRCE